eukprot:scpid29311/ scgid5891/ Protein spinster homolog 1; Protein not really started; Spinster-like protein
MAELAEKDAAPSSAKGIEIMALGQQGSSSSDPERSAILSSNGGQAATLYTGDARAVEGAERPMVLAWKSIKRIVGIRQTPVGLEAGNKRAVAALIVLFFVSVLNQADRWVLPVVAPVGMRCYLTGDSCSNASRSEASCGCVDFNTYDQGVLTGPAFCAVYVISGIPLSYVADRISRTWVLAVGLTFWSIMVFATGFVKTTWQLYLTRMGLGIGEATCTPVAFSMLSDFFPPHLRALALSCYMSGVYFGGATAYGLGALSDQLCWTWLFRIFGIAGFIMLPAIFIVLREPERRRDDIVPKESAADPDANYTLLETAKTLFKCPPFIALCVAASVRNLGGYSLGSWLATFYRVHYDQSAEQYGATVALVSLFGGLLGSMGGGLLADMLSARGAHWKAYVIAVSQVIATPCIIGVFIAPTATASYGILFLAYLTAETWLGCAGAVVQDIMPRAVRCQASAVYVAISTLIGCLGPLGISAILDTDACDPDYKFALLVTVPSCYIASSLLFAGTGVLVHRRFASAPVRSGDGTVALTEHDELDQQTRAGERAGENGVLPTTSSDI